MHYPTKFDDVIYSNFKNIKLFQKLNLLIYASQFMTFKIVPLSFVLLNLESVEMKEKNYKNLSIFRSKKPFQMK